MTLSNLKTKQFWIKEFKSINWSDVLIWISIFLMFMASWQNIDAGKDPCSYCIIRNDPIFGDITCKEYFNKHINVSLNVSSNHINSENLDYGNIQISDN